MVVFVQYEYKFNNDTVSNMLKLINRYFNGIKCSITIDNETIKGIMNDEFINSLPDGQEYVFLSSRMNDQTLTVLSMEDLNLIQYMNNRPDYNKFVSCIDNKFKQEREAIMQFLDYAGSGNESYKFPVKFKNKLSDKDIQNIINSIPDSRVIKYSELKEAKCVVIALVNHKSIIITQDYVGSFQLPFFDFDDGFSYEHVSRLPRDTFHEWDVKYDSWINKCTDDNFASWDKLVI